MVLAEESFYFGMALLKSSFTTKQRCDKNAQESPIVHVISNSFDHFLLTADFPNVNAKLFYENRYFSDDLINTKKGIS